MPPEIEGIIGMQSHTCRQLLGGKSRLGRDCLSAQVEDLQFTWTLRIRLPQELPALCDTESLHFAAPKGIIGLGFQPGKSRKFNQIELVTKPDDYAGSPGPGKVSQQDSQSTKLKGVQMVKRKLVVIVGAILVLLALVALPGCVSQSTYDQLKATYDSLVSGHTDLREAYDRLVTDYENLKKDYSEFQRAYDDFAALVAQYENFGSISDLGSLQRAYEEMKTAYEDFKTTYADLVQAYDDLKQEFEDLKTQLGLDS